MTTRLETTFALNGAGVTVEVAGDEVLVETLRETFRLTSVRATCGIGNCGTCTVLVDGMAMSSCIMLTCQAEGRSVLTSEGLVGARGELHRVQDAFVRHGAYQCSFCIPAMVLTVKAFFEEHPSGTIEDARAYLAGNLCRCGTYPEILQAIQELIATSNGTAGR